MPYHYGASERRDPGFFRRVWAVVIKEFVQMRRDRMTFATMIIVPIMQLVLFGYAINTDPKVLPQQYIGDVCVGIAVASYIYRHVST